MNNDEILGHSIEDLEVGMEASLSKVVGEQDLESFAAISGDNNPVHLDEEYAANSIFKGRIAHGILTAAYISAVLGTKLPGPGSIYISQSLNFRAPVRIGDEVVATVKVSDLNTEKRRVTLECACKIGNKTVLDGQAVLMVPSRS